MTRVIQFDEFELDCDSYQLRRGGKGLKLEKMPMDLLILLATKNGHLVSRAEIVETLWGGEVFVDSEHGINTAIRKIRQALRDDPESPRFVATVHGRGYRFIGPAIEVRELTPDLITTIDIVPEPAGTHSPDKKLSLEPEPRPHLKRRLWPWVLGGLAVAAVIAFAIESRIGGRRERFPGPTAAQPIQSLAVLPLDNLSGNPEQDYFADGMTDELITMLAKNSTLRIVSRTSVMQYKGAHRPLPEIAQALGVDGILEGSISRSGDNVHMNIQLIQGPSDTHVWADSYDRALRDVASLPREAAFAIAKRSNSSVSQSTIQRYVSPEAHDAYLRGRYYWFAENTEKDIEYLKKATELQPDYALAWSGLSAAYDRSAIHGTARPSDAGPLAEEAAIKALQLDDSLSDAHNSMAAVYLFGRWNSAEALKESTRAIELDPNYAEAYFLRSLIFQTMNRLDDALAAQKKSTELDPFARPPALAEVLFRMRNYDAAISQARFRLEALPTHSGLHWLLAEIYLRKGMEEEAAREAEKAALLEGDEAGAASLRHAFERGGYKAIFQLQLEDLQKKASHQYVGPLDFAWAYVNLRRKDQALRFLEDAYRERAPALVWIQNWPEWDFLHSDERYRSVVRRMGLPPAW